MPGLHVSMFLKTNRHPLSPTVIFDYGKCLCVLQLVVEVHKPNQC